MLNIAFFVAYVTHRRVVLLTT